jgi:type VI secretion system protein ImpD
VLARLPYRAGVHRDDGFRFSESVHQAAGEHYLWGNAAFAFASVVVRAFSNYGWFADIRGAPLDELRGGVVADLPIESFTTDAPGIASKPSLECSLSDVQEKDLADLGFIGLRRLPYADYSVFYANQSLQIAPRYDRAEANANARLSCMLQYMLCISRFAHYIKLLGRQCVGSMMTAAECEHFLQKWLMSYCEGSDAASPETKARYPLRAASVEVRETPGRSGAYTCQLLLRPHFQLDDIATGFRLTTLLAPPSAAA